MLPAILLLAGACLAAPVQLAGNCQEQTINLNGPYSMPLTSPANSSDCWQSSYKFIVPQGQFAYAHIVVYNISSDDIVSITDVNNLVSMEMGSALDVIPVWNRTAAWPQSFIFQVQPGRNTQIKYQIDITIQKNMFGQNVKSSTTVDTDGPSALFYAEDLLEGQTYNIISARNLVNLKRAVGSSTNFFALNNVFVYDSGTLIGTLYSENHIFTQDFTLSSITKVLQLYVAKSIAEITKGAVLATDSSNVANIHYHYVEYVPIGGEGHTLKNLLIGDDTRAGAATIIGDKQGSTFDLRQLAPLDDNTAPFSYDADGPMKSNSSWININPKRLPKQFHGNLNTFYVGSGRATFTITLV